MISAYSVLCVSHSNVAVRYAKSVPCEGIAASTMYNEVLMCVCGGAVLCEVFEQSREGILPLVWVATPQIKR